MSHQAEPGASAETDADANVEGSAVSRQQWKWTVLAGMASYLDAGSIVALASGLALFRKDLGLSAGDVGLLAAIGPNAIGCAIGALIGGRLGDVLGRKRRPPERSAITSRSLRPRTGWRASCRRSRSTTTSPHGWPRRSNISCN